MESKSGALRGIPKASWAARTIGFIENEQATKLKTDLEVFSQKNQRENVATTLASKKGRNTEDLLQAVYSGDLYRLVANGQRPRGELGRPLYTNPKLINLCHMGSVDRSLLCGRPETQQATPNKELFFSGCSPHREGRRRKSVPSLGCSMSRLQTRKKF